MKQAKHQHQKKPVSAAEKRDKKHYRIVVGLMIFTVAYYYLLEPRTIGYDSRYLIFIFGLPTFIGMLLLGFYRRRFLIDRFSTNKGFVLWTFMILLYLIQGFMVSYLSFGQVAKISWDYFNNEVVKRNSEETLICPITKFSTGRRSSIDFNFNHRYESFRVNYSTIKDYENKNVNNYYLKIHATKGIWNYYRVNEWSIGQK